MAQNNGHLASADVEMPPVEMVKTRFGTFTANEIMEGEQFLRSRLATVIDPRRDLDVECGYPETLGIDEYKFMYDREGVAARVVGVYPEESWAMDPAIYESEVPKDTPFEKAWWDLNDEFNVLHFLQRADELSGIGRFGVILFGLNDGRSLDQPPVPVERDGTLGRAKSPLKLTFISVFDESLVEIKKWETNKQSRRFGLPTLYELTFNDPDMDTSRGVPKTGTLEVHWSRVVHIADNRGSSEVFGRPRQQQVFNRICDVRKITGGSAEMFWKGGFPGISFETSDALAGQVKVDITTAKKQIEDYSNGLQRYLALANLHAKPLTVTVADPKPHFMTQCQSIAITIGVPLRVFMGSEESKLSSTQDALTWNKRLGRRQHKYITPLLVRPVVVRFVAYGVLPIPDGGPRKFTVFWPDLNTSTDVDKAEEANKRATAFATYCGSGSEQMIPPLEFMVHVLKFPIAVARQIEAASKTHTVRIKPPITSPPNAGKPGAKPAGATSGTPRRRPAGVTKKR